MPLSADAPRFTLVLNGSADFGVYAFHGREAVSDPYAIAVEVVSLSYARMMWRYARQRPAK